MSPAGWPPALGLLVLLLVVPGPCRAAAAAPPLPDTTLAVVSGPTGTPPTRVIGRAEFRQAWAQARPPARPDSLTPATARAFLDLLVDKEAIERMAAGERWTWTARESAQVRSLRDRLVMDAMLVPELEAARRATGVAGDSMSAEALGVAARDRAMRRLAPVWDEALLARLARAFAALPRPTADSSLMAQLRILGAMPVVDRADSVAVLARSSAGDFRVTDLLAQWERLNPVVRPRVQRAEEVRQLAQNGLFERMLRRRGDSLDVAARPDIVAKLERERHRIEVTHLVEREVDQRIPSDSATLAREYQRNEADWRLPLRLRLLRVEAGSATEAADLARRLAGPAQAESLAAQASRQRLSWVIEISAADDSALFAHGMAAGPGAVLGPDRVTSGWRVVRVLAVQPRRSRPFAEVRDLVWRRWYGEDGERRMRELLTRAHQDVLVRINDAALAALAPATATAAR
jgi:hypothetical protein